MRTAIWIAAGLSVLASSGDVAARGLGEAAELEHARANARAGGPISERDAELLERYGCLSGTNNPFCTRNAARDSKPRRKRRDHR